MKAIAYIDGYNLYYGLLKGSSYKWLDLWAFARCLLKCDVDLAKVKYFTSPVKTYPHDPAAQDRQKLYLQALVAQGRVEVIHGFYTKNKALLPAVDERCAECEASKDGYVQVYKMEEKRSDVNLAIAMVTDAALNAADCFLLVTGDSDQVGTVETVRHTFNKQVVVFNPHEAVCKQLDWAASYYKNIPRDLPARCQLPDVIPVGTKGHTIHRPPAWSLPTNIP